MIAHRPHTHRPRVPRSATLGDAVDGAQELAQQAARLARLRVERLQRRSKLWFGATATRVVVALLAAVVACSTAVLLVFGLLGAIGAASGLPTWAAALILCGLVYGGAAFAFWRWRRRQLAAIESLEERGPSTDDMRRSGRKVLRGLASSSGLLAVGGIAAGGTIAMRSRRMRRAIALGLRVARIQAIRHGAREVARAVRAANAGRAARNGEPRA